MDADWQMLRTVRIFSGVPDEQLQQVASSMRRRIFSAGMTVLERDDVGEMVYVIISGTVKVYIEHGVGADVIVAICGPGELLGELNAVDEQGHSASVKTLEPTTCFVIDRQTFRRHLQTLPSLTFNVASHTIERLRLATSRINSLARQDVYARTACQLLAFAAQYGQPADSPVEGAVVIPLRLTQSDMADLIGASRVRVNQVLSAFKRSHYITIGKDYHITLLNPDALRKRCQEMAADSRAQADKPVAVV